MEMKFVGQDISSFDKAEGVTVSHYRLCLNRMEFNYSAFEKLSIMAGENKIATNEPWTGSPKLLTSYS
jgi:hypothetical protein